MSLTLCYQAQVDSRLSRVAIKATLSFLRSGNSPAPTQAELNAREQEAGFQVDRVTCDAGSAIVFTEACKHGTLPWLGASERRTVFMKYAAAAVAWSGGYYNASRWPWITPQQAAMLEPPHVPNGRSWESASARSELEQEIVALREEVKALRCAPKL